MSCSMVEKRTPFYDGRWSSELPRSVKAQLPLVAMFEHYGIKFFNNITRLSSLINNLLCGTTVSWRFCFIGESGVCDFWDLGMQQQQQQLLLLLGESNL